MYVYDCVDGKSGLGCVRNELTDNFDQSRMSSHTVQADNELG